MTLQPDSIVFADAHVPDLEAGTYDITLSQTVTGPATASAGQKARIHVRGPRVALEPSWIESRFPQPATDDADAEVLPHVVLTRSSLPWERGAASAGSGHPWLALLMITAEEAAGERARPPVSDGQATVAALRDPSPGFPGLGAEDGLTDDQLVRVVDIPRGLVDELLPKASWLGHLTHVRERFVATVTDPGGTAADLDREGLDVLRAELDGHGGVPGHDARVRVEIPGRLWRVEGDRTLVVERAEPDGPVTVVDEARAVVLGCRVTAPGHHYRAYLVSVEDRYAGTADPVFAAGGAAETDLVRFVVLDRWEFAVRADADRLRNLLTHLALPEPGRPPEPVGLRVPITPDMHGPGVDMLRAGYALVPHRLRNGGAVRSWYRGPLVAQPVEPPPSPVPHEVADALLLRDRDTGVLLTSYAAAWELGRMLTTADPAVALDLVRWKVERRRYDHRQDSVAANPHLEHPRGARPAPPPTVSAWLRRLRLLDGVPFGYLVPDPAMLPRESLRVFRLEPAWLDALLDGAFGAGRLPGIAEEDENDLWREIMDDVGTGPVSGCLIRSDVVSGWPALHVDGLAGGAPLPVLRRENLSSNVLLVLFAGDVEQVDVHPNPEALHHGVELVGGGPEWRAAPRYIDGQLAGTLSRHGVLDVGAARGDLAPNAFALHLVAGVPKLSLRPTPVV